MTQALFTKFFGNRSRWPLWAQRLFHFLHIYSQDAERSELTKQASSMAYMTLFSLVPSLAAIFTLLGLFLPIMGEHGNIMNSARQFIFKNLATGSGAMVVDNLEKFISGLNLKKIGMSAFTGLLITLVILLRQIEEALNRIWMVHKARPMLTRFIYFWLFLTLGMLALSIILGLSTSYSITAMITKTTLAAADKADDIPILSMGFNWLFTCFLFFMAYKVIPNCEVKSNAARGGAILAGTLFYVISKLYTIYVTSFASYKSIYGTLAAIPIFLMWIYVCCLILLAGALLAWRWQTGWPDLNEDEAVTTALTPLDEHRNKSIQVLLPYVVMLSVYENFRSGKRSTVDTLTTDLHLPPNWVYESVQLLLDAGLLATAKVTTTMGASIDQILPTHPAELLRLSEMQKFTEEPVNLWITSWEPNSSPAIKQFVKNARQGALNEVVDSTFKSLL